MSWLFFANYFSTNDEIFSQDDNDIEIFTAETVPYDIMIDDADKVIGVKPLSKISIKVEQPYNVDTQSDFIIPNIKGLTINLVKQAIDKLKNKTTL